jgi:tetratricopeptide (TPR) repeat protein
VFRRKDFNLCRRPGALIDSATGPQMSGLPMRRSKISKLRKLAFGLIVACFAIGVLEATLAVLGIVPKNQRRDSYVGFVGNVPLFVEKDGHRITNPLKLSYFNQQSFSIRKPAGTKRVFCLGGSTTFGHPYEDSTSFCGWLRRMLEHVEPSKFEVINCGGVSYASYRIALMMEELIQYEPDVFIVYCGHNEFLEARSYGEQRDPGLIARAERGFSKLRISGLFDQLLSRSYRDEKKESRLAAEVDVILDHTDGPESYHRDDIHRAGVVRHYEESLERLIGLAESVGAEMILVKPESNLSQFSPFKSERSQLAFADSVRWEKVIRKARQARDEGKLDVACEHYVEACSIETRDAELLFETGKVLSDLGKHNEAEAYFRRARDEDVCPLRAPSEIIAVIERIGTTHQLSVVDYPLIISRRSYALTGQTIPGNECFLDHVHPTIEAHGDLAVALFNVMQQKRLMISAHAPESLRQTVEPELLASLDRRQQSLGMTRVAQVLAWAGKTREGLASARRAVELSPDSSEAVSQLGRMLEKAGEKEAALVEYQKAVDLNGDDSLARSRLASALFLNNSISEAREHWMRAVETTPASAPLSFRVELQVRLGDCEALLGDQLSARRHYLNAQELDPRSELVRKRISY